MLKRKDIDPYDRTVVGEEGDWFADFFYYVVVGPQQAPGFFPDPVKTPTREENIMTARSETHWAKVEDGQKITASAGANLPVPPFDGWVITTTRTWRPVTVTTWQAAGNEIIITGLGHDADYLLIPTIEPELETGNKAKRETPRPSSDNRVRPLLGPNFGPVLCAYLGENSWVYPYPWPRTTRSSWRDPETQYGTFSGMLHYEQYSDTHYLLTFWYDRWSFGGREVFPEYDLPIMANQLLRTGESHALIIDERRWRTHLTRV